MLITKKRHNRIIAYLETFWERDSRSYSDTLRGTIFKLIFCETTDEKVALLIKRIEELHEENSKLIAEITNVETS